MDRRQGYLERVHQIVLQHLKGQPVRVYLFGSWARGDAQRTSDIDIAILPIGLLQPGLLSHLQEALEESYVPYPIEMVDLSQTDVAFRRRVLEEGILWSD